MEFPLPLKCRDTIVNIYAFPEGDFKLNGALLICFGAVVMLANLVYLVRFVLKLNQKRDHLIAFSLILIWNVLMMSAGGVMTHWVIKGVPISEFAAEYSVLKEAANRFFQLIGFSFTIQCILQYSAILYCWRLVFKLESQKVLKIHSCS